MGSNAHLLPDYTDANGVLTLPERLPLGHFRIVEVQGPAGFYNEWLDPAVYEDGHLKVDDAGAFADGVYFVDFDVTTDRIYQATGDDSENSQDILVIDESYSNRETLGKLTIRKTGEVLTGWEEKATDLLDPQFSGEAVPGDFLYTERPIPYAEYTITANEDNMTDGTMFGSLPDYHQEVFRKEHETIILQTVDTVYVYQVIAVLETDTAKIPFNRTNFANDADFLAFEEGVLESSVFANGHVPSSEDRLLTLVTCSYAWDGARYVVVAVRE